MTSRRQLDRRMARHVAALLAVPIRAIIKLETQKMTDAVADLTAAIDSNLAGLKSLLGEVQKDVALLAQMPKDNTPAIEQQVERLKSGTDAAANALAALQGSVTAAAAPAQTAAAAPATEAAPDAAPAPATPEAPADAAPAAQA